jgi:heat shock protein HtpX
VLFYSRISGGSRRGGGGKGNAAMLIVVVVAVILAIIAPMLAMLIRLAVSRQREYLADAGAVELTRYPAGLIGALEKLGASKTPLKGANRATAHMFIVNPLRNAVRGKGHEVSSAFRTHPPLHDRIDRLRALME